MKERGEQAKHLVQGHRDKGGGSLYSVLGCLPLAPCQSAEKDTKGDPGEGCRDQDAPEEQQEDRSEDHEGSDIDCEGKDIDCAIREERLSSRLLQSGGQGPSFSDYLYFKHRDEGLKELLERKMEKQAVLLGI